MVLKSRTVPEPRTRMVPVGSGTRTKKQYWNQERYQNLEQYRNQEWCLVPKGIYRESALFWFSLDRSVRQEG